MSDRLVVVDRSLLEHFSFRGSVLRNGCIRSQCYLSQVSTFPNAMTCSGRRDYLRPQLLFPSLSTLWIVHAGAAEVQLWRECARVLPIFSAKIAQSLMMLEISEDTLGWRKLV